MDQLPGQAVEVHSDQDQNGISAAGGKAAYGDKAGSDARTEATMPAGAQGPGGGDDFPDLDDASARTPSSEVDKDELEALLEILTEAFNEVDLENSGVISTEQLGTVMDGLAEEGVIDDYTDEELEMLANDMDVERNGYIPLEEFKDVLVRRQDGYDFTEVEIKEAFSVLDVSDTNTVSAKELRAVMLACCEMDVRYVDGKKMILAAASPDSADKTVINFEEFKNIIHWRIPRDDAGEVLTMGAQQGA
mmetsp:Transcript_26355/g.61067  ORF Transcript_26355/g.61067 Transcript_26355/m.61067 type:complete len:248 (+) Transcript_26355:69-812(+)